MRLVRGGGRWVLALAVALAAGSLLGAAPAGAETALAVDPGYAGAFVPGQPVPVRVGIQADRLLRASLEVTVGTAAGGGPVAMAVEVPGGSQKLFLVVAGATFEQQPKVTVRLRENGRVVATAESQLQSTADQELVGLLPGALHGRGVPGPAPLLVDAGTARFAPVGEAELAQAPASLGPLSTLGMDTDELARLAPGARAGVLAWIGNGGRLMVDVAPGGAVPGLPDEWQPGPRGRAAAGLGEVVATDGAMAAGRWANLVEPSSHVPTGNQIGADSSVAATLASEAGLRSPQLAWLVGFLAVYVVVVGPVLFFAVRRRRRPELAWVAVPLVALLFSGGSWAAGRHLRTATQLVHGTVLSTGPAGAVATSYVGVFSRGGETARIGFPTGWSPLALSGDVGGSAGVTGVTLTADGPDARLPLEAGQFGVVAATGPAPKAGGLEVSASTSAGGTVAGTVRNPTQFTLDDVAVFAGSDGTLVGRLDPGEQRDWTVANPLAAGGGAEFRIWANKQFTQPSGLGLWQAVSRIEGPNLRSGGAVVAAGWTRDFAPAVRLDGATTRPAGQTVLVARAPIRLGTPTDPVEMAVRQDVVRDPFNDGFGGLAGPGAKSSVVRFVLPDGMSPAGLVLRSPFGAELWRDGAWQPATCAGPACQTQVSGGACCSTLQVCASNAPCAPPPPIILGAGGTGAPVPVPDAAVRNGVVYARIPGPASLNQGVQLTLGRAT